MSNETRRRNEARHDAPDNTGPGHTLVCLHLFDVSTRVSRKTVGYIDAREKARGSEGREFSIDIVRIFREKSTEQIGVLAYGSRHYTYLFESSTRARANFPRDLVNCTLISSPLSPANRAAVNQQLRPWIASTRRFTDIYLRVVTRVVSVCNRWRIRTF